MNALAANWNKLKLKYKNDKLYTSKKKKIYIKIRQNNTNYKSTTKKEI